jgi:3-oxoacyl-[acyl-carrier protein] reductase
VTGSSRGIGKAIAQDLASRGASVVITYTSDGSREGAKELVAELKKDWDAEAIAVQADLRDVESPKKIVERTVDKFGAVDILGKKTSADFIVQPLMHFDTQQSTTLPNSLPSP